MKFSKFNLIIKEGDKRVLFNTLSGECFKISTGIEEIIGNNLPDQLNKELPESVKLNASQSTKSLYF